MTSALGIAATNHLIHNDAWTRARNEYFQKSHLDPEERESHLSGSPEAILAVIKSWKVVLDLLSHSGKLDIEDRSGKMPLETAEANDSVATVQTVLN